MSYVVRVLRGIPRTPTDVEEYLSAIRHDRYQTGHSRTHETTPHVEDAFMFETLAAAEMAAVFVGGIVEELL